MSVSTNGAGPRTSGAAPLPELEGEWESLYEGEGEHLFENEYLFEAEGEAEEEYLHEAEYEGEYEAEYEGEYEGEYEAEYEDEAEYEAEDEAEYEYEAMNNPLRRLARPDALMEHLGHAAAEAESEAEAEALIGAIAPIAVGMARRAAPALVRATPQLARGLANVTRALRRNPVTRPLVRALPTIAVRTTRSLARQVARGRPVTARSAFRTLAGQTAAVLSDPRRRRAVVRRSRALDRRYHRAVRAGAPSVAPVSAGAVRRVATVLPAAVPSARRPYGIRRTAPVRRAGMPPRPAGMPPMSVAWVPVLAYRPVRPRGPHTF
ncbi:hypothetical protein ACFU53_03575 [Streptomyces sp. NPDC057474]|uniref:hypothetical protein n=1 Tax=Streptomyces sp. NPDC057474 TaxID=3346144 RepID=UPI003686A3EF